MHKKGIHINRIHAENINKSPQVIHQGAIQNVAANAPARSHERAKPDETYPITPRWARWGLGQVRLLRHRALPATPCETGE
jgi:hypothetical protein